MKYNVRVAEVLRTISRAGDVASARPFGFSQQVARVSLQLANASGLGREQRAELLLASLLHGIGIAAVAPTLARLLGSDERVVLARFPVDLYTALIDYDPDTTLDGGENQGEKTGVYLRHILELGRFPNITRAWLKEVGLPHVSAVSGSLLERFDGSGAPDGLSGAQISKQGRILGLAWAMASVRGVAGTAEDEPLQQRAKLMVEDGGQWIEALEGRVFDPELTAAAFDVWRDAAFWESIAIRSRTTHSPFEVDDSAETTEVNLEDPITDESQAPQTLERRISTWKTVAQQAQDVLLRRYIRGRHDVDEDVPDIDRHIDDLLYPVLGAFLEPTPANLGVWLGLLTRMSDAKEEFPENHSARVADLCQELGLVLGLDDAQMMNLTLAARVHRVGRLCLPNALIDNEFQLTEAQREQLKVYPHVTRSILAPLAPLGAMIQAAVLHTERFDGSGFPKRRYGDAIPVEARILAVADTYASLISARPYRPAYSRSRALAIIQAQSGSLFDGLVTDSLEAVARGQI